MRVQCVDGRQRDDAFVALRQQPYAIDSVVVPVMESVVSGGVAFGQNYSVVVVVVVLRFSNHLHPVYLQKIHQTMWMMMRTVWFDPHGKVFVESMKRRRNG